MRSFILWRWKIIIIWYKFLLLLVRVIWKILMISVSFTPQTFCTCALVFPFSTSTKVHYLLFRCSNSSMWWFRSAHKPVFSFTLNWCGLEKGRRRGRGRHFLFYLIRTWTLLLACFIRITCYSFWKLKCTHSG